MLLAAALVAVRFWDPAAVEIMRSSLFDFYQRLMPRSAERLPVTIIDIDEASLNEFGQWPWPRSLLAELVDRLVEQYPSVIGVDFIFPENDRVSPRNLAKAWSRNGEVNEDILRLMKELPDHDQVFAKSISGGPVVLGRMLQGVGKTSVDVGTLPVPYNINFSSGQASSFIPEASMVVPSIRELESAAQGIGLLSLLPERDGIVRRIPTLHRVGDHVFPSLGIEMLRLTLQTKDINVFSDDAGIDHLEVGGIKIPSSANGLTWVYFNEHDSRRYLSASDVLNDRVEPGALAGHLILLGTSASGLLDIRPTPMGQQIAGVEVWAQWLESVLFGQPLDRPNYINVAEILATAIVCLMVIWLVSRAAAAISVALISLVSAILIGLSWWFFTSHLILFDFFYPMLAGIIVFVVLTMKKFWKEEKQRKLLHNTFSLYLSPLLVEDLVAHPENLRLDGESRILTSLFTDLEGFTALSENLNPEALVDVLNRYLDGMCKIAMNHNGTIDKIIGDALHIIFGAPNTLENHAQSALECALEMDKFSQAYNEELKKQGRQFALTRIGIHTGNAVVGNFGGNTRFVYTAYGDTINTAARLESANKHLGTRICISQETARQCTEKVTRPVGHVVVKGKTNTIEVCEPLGVDSPFMESLDDYIVAYRAIESDDDCADKLIKDLLVAYPEDPLVKLYHRRIVEDGTAGVRLVVS